jgi:hypothetical protein
MANKPSALEIEAFLEYSAANDICPICGGPQCCSDYKSERDAEINLSDGIAWRGTIPVDAEEHCDVCGYVCTGHADCDCRLCQIYESLMP